MPAVYTDPHCTLGRRNIYMARLTSDEYAVGVDTMISRLRQNMAIGESMIHAFLHSPTDELGSVFEHLDAQLERFAGMYCTFKTVRQAWPWIDVSFRSAHCRNGEEMRFS